MPVDCYIEGEMGDKLRHLPDARNSLYRIIPFNDKRFPLTRHIDLYGDTVFNRLQLPDLISELRMLREGITHDEDLQYLNNLIDFVSTAVNQVHLYVKFYGD